MRGYVGTTDFSWYTYLAGRPDLEEVNFWQPSGGRNFSAIVPGAPFFFKLKAPHNAIAGFGIFARHTIAPITLAWDAFGIANGAPDFATLEQRIRKYREDKGEVARTYQIGCIMLSQPVFFEQRLWIRPPEDWARSIMQGKTYDLDEGIGRRIYDECLDRLSAISFPKSRPDLLVAAETTQRYGAARVIRPRLGQGTFRLAVLDAYGKACAVTREHSIPVLEAAHIRPYAEEGSHEVSNGLLLRTDIHRLFDAGYVTVTPDYRFEVSRQLKEEFDNGKTYYEMQGRIQEPTDPRDRPAAELLRWHNEHRFLG